jgi:hypothetical protein
MAFNKLYQIITCQLEYVNNAAPPPQFDKAGKFSLRY